MGNILGYIFTAEFGYSILRVTAPILFVIIAYLMRPELFVTENLYVQVETQGKYTTGMTFADKRVNPHRPEPNATVCMGIDREGFVRLLKECCLSYGSGVLV